MQLHQFDVAAMPEDAKRALLEKLLARQKSSQVDHPSARGDRRVRHDLSANQKGLWLIHQLAPASYAYNTPLALQVHGRIDNDMLMVALEQLVERHEVLQTCIVSTAEEPKCEIASGGGICFESRHLSEKGASDVYACLRNVVREPFDLQAGPLMRVYLFTTPAHGTILLFNFHHLIFDGGSVATLIGDLSRLYTAANAKAEAVLPSIESTYADFVSWQADMMAGDAGRSHQAYWHQKLSGTVPLLELPTDRHRPAVFTYNGAVYRDSIPPELAIAIKRIAESEDVSQFTILLSLFYVLLYRYTHQEDIVVGSPLEIRPGRRFESQIGYFVNMVALRSAVSGDLPFCDFLQRVQDMVFEALDHGEYPFAELVRQLAPDFDRSRSPMFQVAFAYQNWVRDVTTVDGHQNNTNPVHFEPLLEVHQEGEFDLTVEVVETAESFQIFYKYNPDLFDESTIARMAGHFQTLAQSMVRDATTAVAELPLLTKAEHDQIETEWNDTKVNISQGQCIHHRFALQAERSSETVAVICEQRQLTYGELDGQANQLAGLLRSKGVGPNVLVGICADRSIEMIVGIIGVLKAGGAYVPFDPNHPKDRFLRILDDTGVDILLKSTRHPLPKLKEGIEIVDLDRTLGGEEAIQDISADESVNTGNLAYVLFTSGSTGLPKGVKISHRNVLAFLDGFEMVASVPPHCPNALGLPFQGMSVCPYYFDVSVWEFFSVLCNGGTLHILSEQTANDPKLLAGYLVDFEITSAYIPPALLEDIAEFFESNGMPRSFLRMLVGVEPIKEKTLQRYRNLSNNMRIVNGYGPTEATICATLYDFNSAREPNRRTPIGMSMPGYLTHVADQHLQPLPVGVTGEIVIGGVGLSSGYLNRMEETEQRFLSNPFWSKFGDKLYRTGDLGRRLSDGNIEYVGRMDNQIKYRGFRIELGEIEAALSRHKAVAQAVVVLREDQPGNPQLVAYVILERECELSVEKLKKFLSTKLPTYMVPVAIRMLDRFPLTSNGKVDRRALPKPESTDFSRTGNYSEPRTKMEKSLVALWEDIIGHERIGVNDNFFELGGHSLLAIRLANRIENTLQMSIPISLLFEAPTVAEMAERIEMGGTDRAFSPLVAIQAKREKPPFFCVHPGDGNVFYFSELACQLGADQPFYALQAYGLEPGTEPLSDIRAMAAKYRQTIRAVQPHGPYLIGGLCGGGTIAFEIAQQLKLSGEDVPLLVLFDALAPHMYTPIDETRFFIGFARDFDGLSGSNLFPIFRKKLKVNQHAGVEGIRTELSALSHNERMHLLWECAQEAGVLQPGVTVEYLARVFNVYSGMYSGLLDYNAEPYSDRIIFFRALDEMIDSGADQKDLCQRWIADSESLELVRKFRETPFLGWDQYSANPIQMFDVPGDHFTMLAKPHVQILKAKLHQCLAAAL